MTGSSTETPYNQKRVTQYLPQYIGIGSSLAHKKWTYALDYLFRQYGVLNSGDSRVKFRDSHELRLGVCYFPNGFSSSSYWKRMSYKAGVSVSTPYLRLKGQSGGAYRVSVSLGLPVLNGRINGKPLLTQVSLKRFEEFLDRNRFCRVHRSYIVSLSHINYIERKRIRIGEELIPISDSYLPALMNNLALQE